MTQTANFSQIATPIARVLISAIFVLSAIGKISNYSATAGYMEAFGVPGALLPLVILSELVFGLMVMVGFHTRIAAIALAGFTALSAIIFHSNFADQNEMTNFMKNLAISGGFLLLYVNGAGAYSFDNRNK